MSWQPIDTAPKMRKVIVHYLNELGKSRTVMACYYEKNSLECKCTALIERDGLP